LSPEDIRRPPPPLHTPTQITHTPTHPHRLGSFLPEYMDPKPGRFVSAVDGQELGEHGNAMFLTVGQGAKVRPSVMSVCLSCRSVDQSACLSFIVYLSVCLSASSIRPIRQSIRRMDARAAIIGRRTKNERLPLAQFLPSRFNPGQHNTPHHRSNNPPKPQPPQIGGAGEKWFVCQKDMARGIVYVAPGTNHPALYTDSLRVAPGAFNWIGPVPPEVRQTFERAWLAGWVVYRLDGWVVDGVCGWSGRSAGARRLDGGTHTYIYIYTATTTSPPQAPPDLTTTATTTTTITTTTTTTYLPPAPPNLTSITTTTTTTGPRRRALPLPLPRAVPTAPRALHRHRHHHARRHTIVITIAAFPGVVSFLRLRRHIVVVITVITTTITITITAFPGVLRLPPARRGGAADAGALCGGALSGGWGHRGAWPQLLGDGQGAARGQDRVGGVVMG
jgi:hypothetical protein